ncbi:MAG: hypothetical protein AAFQ12_11575 [Pseudomonadota bacterium]
MISSLLWLFVTLAFAFDAVGEPCELRADDSAKAHHVAADEMPCHDMMIAEKETHHEAPDHNVDTCCCAALLTTVIGFERSELKQPLPGILAWIAPLNDRAESLPFEYEPPPPRA